MRIFLLDNFLRLVVKACQYGLLDAQESHYELVLKGGTRWGAIVSNYKFPVEHKLMQNLYSITLVG